MCCGKGGTLQTNITGVCGECSLCLGHTGFAPTHSMCAFLVYPTQAPGCSAGELSKAGLGLCAFPRFKLLRFRFSSTPQSTDSVGPAFCALPRSEQLRQPGAWRARSPQVGRCMLSPPWSQPLGFLCAQWERHLRCAVSPLGSWSVAATLLVDVNCPRSQEDLVSNWGPAHSLVEDAISGAEIAPLPPALVVARLPLCLWQGMGQSAAS